MFSFLPFHNCVSASIIFSTKECSSPGLTFIDNKQNIFINPSAKINQNVDGCTYITSNLHVSTYLLQSVKETYLNDPKLCTTTRVFSAQKSDEPLPQCA